jgi:hypothetical protein
MREPSSRGCGASLQNETGAPQIEGPRFVGGDRYEQVVRFSTSLLSTAVPPSSVTVVALSDTMDAYTSAGMHDVGLT